MEKIIINFPFQNIDVEINTTKLYKFIRRKIKSDEDAEDLVQDTLISAICGARNFKGESRPETWVYAIAQNKIRQVFYHGKAAGRELVDKSVETADALDELTYGSTPSAESVAAHNQSLRLMDLAVSNLGENDRILVRLHYFEHATLWECAVAVNIPIGTVRSRLFRAKAKLAKILASKGVTSET